MELTNYKIYGLTNVQLEDVELNMESFQVLMIFFSYFTLKKIYLIL